MLSLFGVAATLLGGGCAYLGQVKAQSEYRRSLQLEPKLGTAKHILQRKSFFVYGRIAGDPAAPSGEPVAVLAISSDLRADEIVEVCSVGRAGSYYGMNLPAGSYRIALAVDLNGNGLIEADEVQGSAALTLSAETHPSFVAGDIDLIPDTATRVSPSTLPIDYTAPPSEPLAESLFYPKGTIRKLDDPLFTQYMSELGMYDPAAFMEAAPLMFYTLEEDSGYKVPVIFVHGIGGSAAEFGPIVEKMDRSRYTPWFFHYPSGLELGRLSQLFYDIFLSGQVIPAGDTPRVIVAHSMGGLIAREALNLRQDRPEEAKVGLLVTLASPFGGMKSAAVGVARAPLVVPAWRDLDPDSDFINGLFRQPLSGGVQHSVLFCALRDRDVANRRGSDGVVPVASQLSAAALSGASAIGGVRASHAGVLREPLAVEQVVDLVSAIRSPLPEEQLRLLDEGGFAFASEPDRYSALEAYILNNFGHLLRALARGDIEPASPYQERFLGVLRDGLPAEAPAETGWIKFAEDFPERAK